MHLKFIDAILIIFLVCCTPFANGQSRSIVDSLRDALKYAKQDTNKIRTLNRIGIIISDIDPQQGIQYANEAINLANQLQWKKGLTGAYLALGRNYMILSENEKADANMQKSLQFADALKDTDGMIKALLTIGFFYVNIGKTKDATDYFDKALSLSEKIQDNNGIGKSYYGLGMVYHQQKDWQQAKRNFEKAIPYAMKLPDKPQMMILHNRLGIVTKKLGNVDTAIYHYNQSLKLATDLGIKNMAAGNELNLGIIYKEQKKYHKALEMVQHAFEVGNENSDIRLLATAKHTSGDIYLSMAKDNIDKVSNTSKAITFLKDAVSDFKKGSDIASLQESLSYLAQAYELQGNYKEALDIHKEASLYKDSIFTAENKQTIKDLESKREIEARDNKLKINELALSNERRTKTGLLAGAILLFLIGGLLFYQNRLRSKTNTVLLQMNRQLDDANKVKTKFFGIMSHDLRSPIINLLNFLHFQKELPQLMDGKTIEHHREQLTHATENVLDNMEAMLLWSKSQMDRFLPQKSEVAIAELFEYIQQQFSGHQNIWFQFNNDQNLTLYTDKDYLKSIMYNLTANAVKALQGTEHPNISWKAAQANNTPTLTITDNGPGVHKEQIEALYNENAVIGTRHGLGLHIIRDLANAINCRIQHNDGLQKGSGFSIIFNG